MPHSKNKPIVLLLEATDPSESIILSLEGLERNNSKLRKALQSSHKQLDKLREMVRKL